MHRIFFFAGILFSDGKWELQVLVDDFIDLQACLAMKWKLHMYMLFWKFVRVAKSLKKMLAYIFVILRLESEAKINWILINWSRIRWTIADANLLNLSSGLLNTDKCHFPY